MTDERGAVEVEAESGSPTDHHPLADDPNNERESNHHHHQTTSASKGMGNVIAQLKKTQQAQRTTTISRRPLDEDDEEEDDGAGTLMDSSVGTAGKGIPPKPGATVSSAPHGISETSDSAAVNVGTSHHGSHHDNSSEDINMKGIFTLAGPAMATQVARVLSVVFMFLFAARLSSAEFAGISLGLTFSNITMLTFGVGISMVLDTVSTQQYGADPQSPRLGLFWRRAVLLFLVWAIPMWISYFLPFWETLLMKLFGHHVGFQTLTFLQMTPLSNIPLAILFCTQKTLNAQKKVKYPMYGQIVASVVSLPACYIGSQNGIVGIGIALGVARVAGLGVMCGLAWKDEEVRQTFGDSWTFADVVDKDDSKRFLSLIPHSVFICVAERWSFEGFSIIAGLLGPVHQNAYSIATNITNTLFAFAVGGYTSGNTLVGNMLGKGRPDLAKRAAFLSVKFILMVTGVAGLILFIIPRLLVRIYTSNPDMIKESTSVLRIAPFMLILDNAAYTFQGIFRACGEMGFLSTLITASHWVISLPFAALFAFATPMKVEGIILGLIFGLLVQAGFSVKKYMEQDWQAIALRAVAETNNSEVVGASGDGTNPSLEEAEAN